MNNYRGRCKSRDKFTKTGDPKMSGNFSYHTFRMQQLQYKEYEVDLVEYESGIKQLVVGENKTPLANILGDGIVRLAIEDLCFKQYVREGKVMYGRKFYDARQVLAKNKSALRGLFSYREEVYTDGEFIHKFKNY